VEADLLSAAAEIAAEIEGEGLSCDRASVATVCDLPADHPGITDAVMREVEREVERAYRAARPAEVPDGCIAVHSECCVMAGRPVSTEAWARNPESADWVLEEVTPANLRYWSGRPDLHAQRVAQSLGQALAAQLSRALGPTEFVGMRDGQLVFTDRVGEFFVSADRRTERIPPAAAEEDD
jgi:hypothetical protein